MKSQFGLVGFLLAALALVEVAPRVAWAQSLTLEPIATGLARPVDIAHAGDGSGRLFIVLQGGQIVIHDGNAVLPMPFLDIGSLVTQCSRCEQGLLGLAFHPEYSSESSQGEGFFYVNYTDKASGDTAIARYKVSPDDPNRADPSSKRILLTVTQPKSSHNGGQLRFGRDGYLYIALGDGGGAGDPDNYAQKPGELLGKMLRIDVDIDPPYVPPDNPFVDDDAVRNEIWAFGLRNPWRFSFDRQTGDLFIADVGQNAREEVSFQPAGSGGGENYGWSLMEGSECFNPSSGCNEDGSLVLPILEYGHGDGDCSITGGYRYRGRASPHLFGLYFYADFCTGRIWAATEQGDGSWTTEEVLDTANRFSTFGEDEDGELYIAHLNDTEGIVFRIVAKGPHGAETTINDLWQTVSLPAGFKRPVVIAGVPTFNDSQPGVVRLRNVAASGFEVRFQEWTYLDGTHVQETLPYLVLEGGRGVMADGSIWEAGSFLLGGTAAWQSEVFSQAFAAPPALFLTVQTFNGGQAATVRARNVTVDGFQAALFEQEALMDGHLVEEVGYLALHSPAGSGEIAVSGNTVPYLLQSSSVDQRFAPLLSSALKVEEEKSKDTELGHTKETLSVLALGKHLFAQDVTSVGGDTAALRRLAPEYGAPMEWGTVDGVSDAWTTVPLAKSFTDPVVVAKPVSANGWQPGVIRVRNVTGDSFELRYQEWLYLDGSHIPERVFYLVAEAGQFSVAGLDVKAGRLNSRLLLGNGFETVTFPTAFSDIPALFTGVMTANGADPVITRVKGLAPSGFFVTMDEEEAKTDSHIAETLGWIAIERGSGTTTDQRDVAVSQTTADDQPATTPLGLSADRLFPVLVGDVVSTYGTDPVFLRYRNLTPSAAELYLQEEQSLDAETAHLPEDVSIFAAE